MTEKDDMLEAADANQSVDQEPSERVEHAEQNESAEEQQADAAEKDGEIVSGQALNDEIDNLKEALEAAEAKARENWDKVLRVQADMENTRKTSDAGSR